MSVLQVMATFTVIVVKMADIDSNVIKSGLVVA